MQFVLNAKLSSLSSSTVNVSHALQRITKAWLDTRSRDQFVQMVNDYFAESYGPGWHIIVGREYAVQVRYRQGCCMVVSSAQLNIKMIVFRAAGDVPVFKHEPGYVVPCLPDVKYRVESCNINDKEGAVAVVCSVVEKHGRRTDHVASQIKQQLTKVYGSTWHVVAALNDELLCTPYDDYDVNVPFVDVVVYLSRKKAIRVCGFQYNGHDVDNKLDMIRLSSRFMIIVSMVVAALYGYLKLSCPVHCLPSAKHKDPKDCSALNIAAAVRCETFQFYAFVAFLFCMFAGTALKVVKKSLRSVGKRKRS